MLLVAKELDWLDVRLVNGVVDQSVRCNTSSVANRAEDARLPLVFVDILHGACEFY